MSWKRKGFENERFARTGKIVRHHILNRCHKGTSDVSNLLQFDKGRENAWHFLFKNMSFREVAALLLRTCEMKGQED